MPTLLVQGEVTFNSLYMRLLSETAPPLRRCLSLVVAFVALADSLRVMLGFPALVNIDAPTDVHCVSDLSATVRDSVVVAASRTAIPRTTIWAFSSLRVSQSTHAKLD